jgi:NADPH-dependent F420 reductase
VDVTIIGAGNMGRGIGTRVLAAGSNLTVLDSSRDEAASLADDLLERAGARARATGRGADEPIEGEVVVLAVPYAAVSSVAEQHRSELGGKIVVDITNPVDFESFDRLITPPDTSAAEEIAKMLPESRVVKAFNTTFAGTLVEGSAGGQELDVFIAGDDDEAKNVVADLVEDGGLNPIDVGPLRRARELEALGFLHMTLQQPLGTGFSSAIKVVA